jgi:hypothetical protein
MALAEFSVVYESPDDDIIIHCFDGRELVLARVTRQALDDHFGWPWSLPDEKPPSRPERCMVVDRNLAALEPVIQGKYGSGQFKNNATLKMIEITGEDIPKGRVSLTDSVIQLARASRLG